MAGWLRARARSHCWQAPAQTRPSTYLLHVLVRTAAAAPSRHLCAAFKLLSPKHGTTREAVNQSQAHADGLAMMQCTPASPRCLRRNLVLLWGEMWGPEEMPFSAPQNSLYRPTSPTAPTPLIDSLNVLVLALGATLGDPLSLRPDRSTRPRPHPAKQRVG